MPDNDFSSSKKKDNLHIIKYADGKIDYVNEDDVKNFDKDTQILEFNKTTNDGHTMSGIINLKSEGVASHTFLKRK